MDSDGWPYYKAIDKCIECGLCYDICSQIPNLDPDIKGNAQWKGPFGKVMEISVAQAKDPGIREMGVDGGVVSSILIHLFETGRIDGAIVSKSTRNGRVSYLAKSKEDILDSTGMFYKKNQGMFDFAHEYSTFSPSTDELRELKNRSLKRVAFVGVPCQINTIRKMQALNLVPSDIIQYCFGIFCSGNYHFKENFLKGFEEKYGFSCTQIERINIKEQFIISLSTGEQRFIGLGELGSENRLACDFCDDFSAGYADISFGGTGAPSGWTTVVTRTESGAAILAGALKNSLEPFRFEDDPKYISRAGQKIEAMSDFKRQRAEKSHKTLIKSGVKVIC